MRIVALFQKVVALSLLLVVLSPFYFVVQKTLSSYRANEDEIAGRAELFDRLRAIAAFYKSAPAERVNTEGPPEVLLGNGTPAVLSAGLQAKLRDMATPLGVDIIQVGELPPKTIANLKQVGIHVDMSGPLQGVHQLLQIIDTNTPWLFTSNVQFRSSVDPSFESPTEPPLILTVDIWGLAAVEQEEKTVP
jgi:hypothetical protein